MPLLPPPPPDFPPPIERLILRPGPAFNVSLSDDFGFLFFCLGSPRTHSPPCPADISSGFHARIRRRPDACLADISSASSPSSARGNHRRPCLHGRRIFHQTRSWGMCKPAAFPSSARGNHRRQQCESGKRIVRTTEPSGSCKQAATPFRAVSDNRYQYKEAAGLAAAAAKSVAGNRCPDRNSASGTSSCTRQRDKDFQRGLKILCTCSPGYVSGRRTNCRLAATDMCHQEQMRWGSHRRSDTRQRDRQAYALGRSVDRRRCSRGRAQAHRSWADPFSAA